MNTNNLKHALIELKAALDSGAPLDPEMVDLLKTLDVDIQARLRQSDAATPDEESTLTIRSREISAKFAAEHPHLEPVLRELTDTLHRIGI